MRDERNDCLLEALKLRMDEGLDTPAWLMKALYFSVTAGKVAILKDRRERPAGYLVWASLGAETVRAIRARGTVRLQREDFDEGRFLYVFDMMKRARSSLTLADLLAALPARTRVLMYQRRGRLVVVRRAAGRARVHATMPADTVGFVQ